MGKVQSIFAKSAIDEIKTFDSLVNVLHGDITKLVTTIESLNKTYAKSKTSQDLIIKAQKDQATNQKKLNTVTTEAQKVSKQLATTTEKLRIVEGAQSKGLIKKRTELQKTTQEIKRNILISKAQKGSYDAISLAIRKNTAQWRAMSQAERENSAQSKKLTATIARQEKALKRLDSQIGRSQRNVGNYSGALMGAGRSLMAAFGVGGGLYLAIGILKNAIKASVEFEKSLSSLSAITGLTGKELDFLANKANQFSKETLQSATNILKAFELVGSLRPELLASKEALSAVTKSAIVLNESTGGKLGLEGSVEALTAGLNQFNLSAAESDRVINTLAAGSLKGSATADKVAASMAKFGTVANDANITLEQSVALIELLATKQLFGEESGTALRGSILRLQSAGLGYKSGLFNINDALDETNELIQQQATELDKDQKLIEIFGQRNIVTGKILLNNTDKFKDLTEAVTDTTTAYEQQIVQNDNLAGSTTKLGSAWESFNIRLNNSNGLLKEFVDNVTLALNAVDQPIGSDTGGFIASLFGIGKGLKEEAISEHKEFMDRLNGATKEELQTYLANATILLQSYIDDGTEFQQRGALRQVRIIADRIMTIQEMEEAQAKIEKAANDKKVQAAKDKADAELKITSDANEKELAAERKLQADLAAIGDDPEFEGATDEEIESAKLDKARDESEEYIALMQAESEEIIAEREREIQAHIILLENQSKSREEIEKDINDYLNNKYIEDTENFITYLENQLAALKISGKERTAEYVKIETELKNLRIQLRQQTNDKLDDLNKDELQDFIDATALKLENDQLTIEERTTLETQYYDAVDEMRQRDVEKEKEAQEKKLQTAVEHLGLLQDLSNRVFGLMQMNVEEDMRRNEESRQFDLELAGDNEKKKDAINEKYDKKAAELKTKAAKQEKAQAIISTTINTAVAAIRAYVDLGPIAGTIAAALIAVLGAAAIATIASQPIPKFAKGTKSSPAGIAEVGEKGKELFVTPKGEVGLFKDRTLANLEKGTRIYSNPETERILKQAGGNVGYDNLELKETNRKLDRLNNTIKNKKELTIIPSKNRITERSGNYYKTYINRKITG